jgi:predicted O-methyltransferase YrrM
MYPRILQRFDNFFVSAVNKYANYRWYNSPLTSSVNASREQYFEIANTAKSKKYELIDDFEKQKEFKINQDWYHELALHTQVVVKKSDICYVHGRLLYASLYKHIKENDLTNINIVETGTARGFSALCMAKAMEDANVEGKIITFDVLPHDTKMYWNCIDDHEGKKTRAELLKNYSDLLERYIFFHQGNTKIELPKVQIPRIHFAFLDSAHDYYYLMAEFKNVYDKQKKGDIIFFDDYTPKLFPGVVKAIDEICEKYKYSKKVITIGERRAYVIAQKL